MIIPSDDISVDGGYIEEYIVGTSRGNMFLSIKLKRNFMQYTTILSIDIF